MIALRLPPRIKVLEALGAVADGRVKIIDDHYAEVVSSEGDRVYRVYTDLSRGVVDSSDNGTVYRGYIGYPILSVLMIRGFLPFNKRIAEALRGIRWRELNERYKSYSIVENIVVSEASKKGVSRQEIENFINEVMKILGSKRFYREKVV
jgi:hypothetical protein